eukprot:GEMP01063049.1.p1 GENE.GEMP01063049.1~~GEMP01063049.1.p1  ORF type:complete len:162 (+),score=33.69 GEMP01063049.1:106-591(+)
MELNPSAFGSKASCVALLTVIDFASLSALLFVTGEGISRTVERVVAMSTCTFCHFGSFLFFFVLLWNTWLVKFGSLLKAVRQFSSIVALFLLRLVFIVCACVNTFKLRTMEETSTRVFHHCLHLVSVIYYAMLLRAVLSLGKSRFYKATFWREFERLGIPV